MKGKVLLRAPRRKGRCYGALRQTVFFTHDRAADHFEVHVQIGDHAHDDSELLGILLAEERLIGARC